MEILVSRDALNRALTAVLGAIEARGTIPIIHCIHLVAAGDGLTLTGTDLTLWVSADLECQVIQPGGLAINAGVLGEIVRNLPSGSEIGIGPAKSGRVAIKGGRSDYKIAVLDPRDFPAAPACDGDQALKLNRRDLATLLDRTRFAASTEEVRPYLCGVFLEREGAGLLTAVATDGHRLAWASAPVDGPWVSSAIVPTKAVGLMLSQAGKGEGECTLTLTSSRARLQIDDITINSALISGNYANWRQAAQTNRKEQTVEIDRLALAAAVRRVGVVDSGKTRAAMIAIDGGRVTISCQGMNGRADEEVAAEGTPPDWSGAWFAVNYLGQALDQLASDTIEIAWCPDDPVGPARVQPPTHDAEHGDVWSIIMPRRG